MTTELDRQRAADKKQRARSRAKPKAPKTPGDVLSNNPTTDSVVNAGKDRSVALLIASDRTKNAH
jgi:hypothetical protein